MAKSFLLQVTSSSEYDEDEPQFLLVRLSDAELFFLHGLRKTFLEFREQLEKAGGGLAMSRLRRLTLWDSRETFFAGRGLEDIDDEDYKGMHDETRAKLKVLYHGAEHDVLPLNEGLAADLDDMLSDEEIGDALGYQRMDYVVLDVSEEGLRWHGCPKHSDSECTSNRLNWTLLDKE